MFVDIASSSFAYLFVSGLFLGGALSASTDILMDLLSIGSSPVQNGPSASNFSPPSKGKIMG
jgi:hypothetical protein